MCVCVFETITSCELYERRDKVSFRHEKAIEIFTLQQSNLSLIAVKNNVFEVQIVVISPGKILAVVFFVTFEKIAMLLFEKVCSVINGN